MKLIGLLLIIILSPLIQAASLDSLIAEHGKKAIVAELEGKLNHKLTVIINGDMVQAHSPNPDFMTAETLAIDINRAGLTVNQLAAEFEKRQQQAKAEQIRIEEINRQYQAKLEQQRQQAQRYREEEMKFWAEASDDEKQKFHAARANAEKEQLAQQKAAVEAENRRLRAEIQQHQSTANRAPIEQPARQQRASVICHFSRQSVFNDLKTEMERRYDGHYSTQKMLIDHNMQAFDSLCSMGPTLETHEIKALDSLIKRYYPNWSTIKMLYDHNMKAYHELNR